MIRSFLTNLLAKRFAFPLVVLAAIFIIGVNEYTHRLSTSTLRAGIALTDNRILTGRLLQALTDAESAQRSYLLTQDVSFLVTYSKAMDVIPTLRASVVPFLDLQSKLTANDINAIIDSRLSELSATINLAGGGSAELAVEIVKAGAGKHWMDKLRQLIDEELGSAAKRQSQVRISIYEVLNINHAAVFLLTLSSVVAMYFFIRQLRMHFDDRQSAQAGLELTIEQRTLELRDLARHLETVREAEKDHLARELHDELGALLTVAKLDLEGVRKRVDATPELTARLERLSSRLNEVIVLKRRMVEDMRPSSLTMLGLRSTLEQFCRDMAGAMGIAFHVDIEDVKEAPDTELVIFRFVQEALTNMAKHSDAKNVSVSLHKTNHRLDIVVSDDGAGFDVDQALAGHHGLTGMRYRIASVDGIMTLQSKPGLGTTISASISV